MTRFRAGSLALMLIIAFFVAIVLTHSPPHTLDIIRILQPKWGGG